MPTPSLALSPRDEYREEKSRPGLWSRLRRGFRKLLWRADWEDHLGPDWAEKVFAVVVTDRYFAKQGRSVGRLVLTEGLRPLCVFLKRHYRLPWWQGLLAAVFPGARWSPGWQETSHLLWAKENGIPVPEVVAAGEFVRPGGRLQSFLAVEELSDMLPLHEAIPLAYQQLSASDFARWKRDLIVEMARLTRILHDQKHYHKDLYLCHFYVARDDCSRVVRFKDRVYMIDFHRLAHHPFFAPWYLVKDLGQLLFSTTVEGITARDRLRFWRIYRDGKPRPWLTRLIRMRSGLYQQHDQNRKGRRPETPAADPLKRSA